VPKAKHLYETHHLTGTCVWLRVKGEGKPAKAFIIDWFQNANPLRCIVRLKFERKELNDKDGIRMLCHEAFDEALDRVGP